MNSRLYLKKLFLLFGVVFLLASGYVYSFSSQYPLPVTSRISFDAKIKFIREHIDVNKIDTIIVGSSIGLNNVNGVALQKACRSCKGVLNLSVYEASPVQAEQLLELTDFFPNLKRVVYSAQFSDFQHASSFRDYHAKTIGKYLSHTLNPASEAKLIFNASKNLPFLMKRAETWEKKHTRSNLFTYLGFDESGSVPLEIYGKDIIQHRWKNPHGSLHIGKAFDALDRLSQRLHHKGIRFYFVQQPYRQPLIKKYPHVKAELEWFLHKVTGIVSKHGGEVLSLYRTLPLSDKYFADRSHLNKEGSIIGSEAIGKFIDSKEQP